MFGLICALHLSYSKELSNTSEFNQKILLSLEDGKLKPRIKGLNNDLMIQIKIKMCRHSPNDKHCLKTQFVLVSTLWMWLKARVFFIKTCFHVRHLVGFSKNCYVELYLEYSTKYTIVKSIWFETENEVFVINTYLKFSGHSYPEQQRQISFHLIGSGFRTNDLSVACHSMPLLYFYKCL